VIPSLSEIFTTARKAAKGANYSWGLADEVGRATAWLWEHGIDSITPLAALLDHGTPNSCPVRIGTRLCDTPPNSMQSAEYVQSPIFLLFFAAELGKITETTVKLTIGKAVYFATPKSTFVSRSGIVGAVTITCQAGAPSGTRLSPQPRRTAPKTAWERLGYWEHKTYAPASEASRLAGAGAGLSDND